MSQIELPYDEIMKDVIANLVNHDLMTLATGDGKRVYARTVMTTFEDLTVYLGTKKNSRKYQQIESNPYVALAGGRFQIEGKAKILGHPKDMENSVYLDRFKEQQPERFESQDSRGNFDNPNMRVIKIEPDRVAYYVQGPSAEESYIAILEPEKKKAYKLTREKDQF